MTRSFRTIALLAATYLPTVGQIAERHPRLKLIVDHLGRPSGTKDDAAWANLPEMLALARNVSDLAFNDAFSWGADDVLGIKTVIHEFGGRISECPPPI